MNLLNEASDSKFVTRKWNIVYNTEVLKSNLCDNNNAYILLIDIITIVGNAAAQVALKICAPFTKPITKIDGTTMCY